MQPTDMEAITITGNGPADLVKMGHNSLKRNKDNPLKINEMQHYAKEF